MMGNITAIAGRLWMMSLQACELILVVLAVRIFLKKFPKIYSYCLWALVGVRLLCPVFVEASFSLQPEIQNLSGPAVQQGGLDGAAHPSGEDSASSGKEPGREGGDSAAYAKAISKTWPGYMAIQPYEGENGQILTQNNGFSGNLEGNAGGNPEGNLGGNPKENADGSPEGSTERISGQTLPVEKGFWEASLLVLFYAAGIAIFACIYIVQYVLVKRRIRLAVREKGNIWICENIRAPFVLGITKPKIILPFSLQEEEKAHILKHEEVHIKHHDPFFRLIGILCICLHWWNPFVWLAVHRMNQDMEMYCDEAVLRSATAEEKKSYARTLLSFAQKQSGLAIGLAFGESNTERRVRNIMYKRKGSIIIISFVVLLSIFCIATLMTIPGSANGKEEIPVLGKADGEENLPGGKEEAPEKGSGEEDIEGRRQEGGQENNGITDRKESQDNVLYTENLTLEPYGEVAFAVVSPDLGLSPYADMAFRLTKDGEEVYAFLPNGRAIRNDKWEFQRVSEVDFLDMNEDGFQDLITIAEYRWEGTEWSEACIYTGTDDGKWLEEIYLEEAYNQSHKEKSALEAINFVQENRDYFRGTSIYGQWSITEYVGLEDSRRQDSLSEGEIQSIVGMELEYGRYYYTAGQEGHTVENYRKELVPAREFDIQMGVTTEELGLAAVRLNYYALEGVPGMPFGSRFYQIDTENALIYYQGAFFRAARRAEADRELSDAGYEGEKENPENQGNPGTAGNIENSDGEDAGQQTASAREKMIAAYIAALENLHKNQILPNGERRDLWDSDSIENNYFALYDVDSDGVEELIIQYTTTYVAGQTEAVYHYDSASGTLRQELLEFPLLSYYSNGTVKARLSHNHGMAANRDDFWPYQLYCYNPASGVYEWRASVDAWDKGFQEKDWEGNLFPDELDLDGDGMLYACSTLDGFSAAQNGEKELIDGVAYEEWLDSYIGEAKLLPIPYMPLTRENIQALR